MGQITSRFRNHLRIDQLRLCDRACDARTDIRMLQLINKSDSIDQAWEWDLLFLLRRKFRG